MRKDPIADGSGTSSNTCCFAGNVESPLEQNLTMPRSSSSPPQLDFNKVQHCARREELGRLLECVWPPRNSNRYTPPQDHHGCKRKRRRPASIWIEGEAGIGKSDLLEQFRECIASADTPSSSYIQASMDETQTCTEKDGDVPPSTSTGGSSKTGVTKDELSVPLPAQKQANPVLHHHSPNNTSSVICVQGKFEERAAASEPFAALSDAMGGLVRYISSLSAGCSSSGREEEIKPDPSWAQGLQDALGTEWTLLVEILPVLRPIFTATASDTLSEDGPVVVEEEEDDYFALDDAFGNFSSKEWRFERFRFAFRTFIRYVCQRIQAPAVVRNEEYAVSPRFQRQHPQQEEEDKQLVLLLDDFHWVDPDSLQIIKTLLEDRRRPSNFLIVVATRLIRDCPCLSKFQETLRCGQEEKTKEVDLMEVVRLSRLTVPEIEEILMTLLDYCPPPSSLHDVQQADETTTRNVISELAQVVQTKTNGNSFVVVQFLRLLQRSGHFIYTPTHNPPWQFNCDKIRTQVDSISDSVSQVVAHNLESFKGRRRSALMVAASFGVSQFDVSTVVHAMKAVESQEQEDGDGEEGDYEDPCVVKKRVAEMDQELTQAAREGYVEEMAPGHYRFAHDRIRESAYSLLPSGKSRRLVHLKVGRHLRSWMDTSAELGFTSAEQGFSREALLLHAAKQSNLGADLIDDDWELLDLAELNYQAAELAASRAAFYSAKEYLQVGLSHLGTEAWEKSYDWALKFSNALTRMQYCCGLLADCWETSGAIICNGKTFRDKSRAYFTRILCLMQQDRNEKALELILDALELQGRPLPRKNIWFRAGCEYLAISRFLKAITDDEYTTMPVVLDETIETYVQFLEKVGEVAWLKANFGYVLFYTFRLLTLFKEKGNYPMACHGLALWGMFQSQFGNFCEGSRYAKLATTLAGKLGSAQSHVIPRFDIGKHGFLENWQSPIRNSLELIVNAFERLWILGMVETAIQESPALFHHLFVSGEPLARVARECDRYSEVFSDYNQLLHWYINAPIFQAVLNLQGRSKNPALLTGTHMDADTCLKAWASTANGTAEFHFQFWSMYVAYHFGEYEVAKCNIKAMGNDLFEFGAGVLVPVRLLFTGLVYFALFRKTGRLKYRRRALGAYKKLKCWESKGVVVCIYMCRLLEAEKSSSCRRRQSTENVYSIRRSYDKAIEAAVEANHGHDHALAHECCGVFLFSQGDENSPIAKVYLAKAAELYQLWGAEAKVDDLVRHYGVSGETYKQGASALRGLDTETETSFLESSRIGCDSTSPGSSVLPISG